MLHNRAERCAAGVALRQEFDAKEAAGTADPRQRLATTRRSTSLAVCCAPIRIIPRPRSATTATTATTTTRRRRRRRIS